MTATAATSERRVNVTFHGIGDAPRPLDAGEAAVWITTQHFTRALDAIAGRSEVRLCFDDGNSSDVTVALPELQRRGLRATFFVVADRVDRPGFLSAADIRSLAAEGMALGCHGMSHRPWRRLRSDQLRVELLTSRARLEDILGCPVTEAACPFGAYDRRTLRSLRRFGYARVFTSDMGWARDDQWLQARNTVRAGAHPRRLDDLVPADPSLSRALTGQLRLAAKRWR
jgi:peptidoglycan/xylan/chitin deacetylase (PgdA/CDA1 family)